MPHFHSVWWAALLLPLAAIVVLAWRRSPPTITVSSIEPFRPGTAPGGRERTVAAIPLCLHGIGLCLLTIALMRPQEGTERIIRHAEGIDIMLALDVSGSMQAYDIPETYRDGDEVMRAIRQDALENRLNVAQKELKRFVEDQPNDRIGLIVFAKLPYVVCPPTLDHDYLLNNLQLLDAGQLPDGTGIAAPVTSATDRLKGSEAKRRVLVLFTDGDNNVEAPISPSQAAKVAKTFDVVLYTVGIGSDRSVLLLDSPFGKRLRSGVAGFNEDLLRQMADTTGGRYFEAQDAAAFHKVMEEINRLEKTKIEQPVYIDYREQFLPWTIAGLGCILLACVLENTRLQHLP